MVAICRDGTQNLFNWNQTSLLGIEHPHDCKLYTNTYIYDLFMTSDECDKAKATFIRLLPFKE